jgi:hypothetical protein
LENGGEVCLEEEVERLRRSGMSAAGIARKMGVDRSWVQSIVSMSGAEDPSATNPEPETDARRASDVADPPDRL